MRVLGRIRLSRDSEESTSVVRQREAIEAWAKMQGHEIVAWAEDVEVSGSLNPFETPELGKYLTEERAGEWDILVAWKLDRVARNAIGINQLFGWLLEHNKSIATVEEQLDLSNWVGRMVASVLSGVAEGELEAIKARVRSSQKKLRETGRWQGGTPPYGYKPSKLPSGGWELVLDPDEQIILQSMIQEALKGVSANSIAKKLNENGIPTMTEARYGKKTNKGWDGASVRRILRSKALLGWTTYKSKPLLDEVGKPILKGPPSITIEDFTKLQGLMEKRSHRQRPGQTSPLLGVLFCPKCHKQMHIRRLTKTPRVYRSYYCDNGCLQHALNADVIESIIEEQFHIELGKYPVMVKKTTPGINTAVEYKETKEAYDELVSYLSQATSKAARESLFKQLDLLGDKLEALEATNQEDVDHWEETGETYAEAWDRMTTEERRLFLISIGVRVEAEQLNRGTRHAPGLVDFELFVPQDLQTVLNEK
ncbi:recombinase family protein [Corynebacterium phoceense]|uniref:recombinase family protein n=1 Tax=Corynebacterium phoceense TaxID=1686286 RepID=UPI000839D156|nr:recombinase family protein [Corynebacterium phoceense]MBF9011952.1 recombinase family protein [Corynebacterium phoceense]